jgi:hypothetical protein
MAAIAVAKEPATETSATGSSFRNCRRRQRWDRCCKREFLFFQDTVSVETMTDI